MVNSKYISIKSNNMRTAATSIHALKKVTPAFKRIARIPTQFKSHESSLCISQQKDKTDQPLPNYHQTQRQQAMIKHKKSSSSTFLKRTTDMKRHLSPNDKRLDRLQTDVQYLPLHPEPEIKRCIDEYSHLLRQEYEESERNRLIKQLIEILQADIQVNKRSNCPEKRSHSYQNSRDRIKSTQKEDFQVERAEKQVQKIVIKTNLMNAENMSLKAQAKNQYKERQFWDRIYEKIGREFHKSEQAYNQLLLFSSYCAQQKVELPPQKQPTEPQIFIGTTIKDLNKITVSDQVRQGPLTPCKISCSQISQVSISSNYQKPKKHRKISFQKMMETMKFISLKSLKTQRKIRELEQMEFDEKSFRQNGQNVDTVMRQWLEQEADPQFIQFYLQKASNLLEIPREELRNFETILADARNENKFLNGRVEKMSQQISQYEAKIRQLSAENSFKTLTHESSETETQLNKLSSMVDQLAQVLMISAEDCNTTNESHLHNLSNRIDNKIDLILGINQPQRKDQHPTHLNAGIQNFKQNERGLKRIQFQNYGQIMNLYDEQLLKATERDPNPNKKLKKTYRSPWTAKGKSK